MGGLFRSLIGQSDISDVVSEVNTYVTIINFAFIAFCLLLVSLYAIWIGWKFAKAQDDGARKNAKSQLIYALIGICSISIVMVFIGVIIPAITPSPGLNPEAAKVVGLVNIYNAVFAIVNMILTSITTLALMFGVYVGWQFMKAEDDAKRKNAKQQLMYVLIGIAAVMLINSVCGLILGSVGE